MSGIANDENSEEKKEREVTAICILIKQKTKKSKFYGKGFDTVWASMLCFIIIFL